MVASTANSSGVVDVTHILDKEEGTSFSDQDVMFQSFEGGDVFYYDQAKAADFKEMFNRYGKAETLDRVLALPLLQANRVISREGAKTKVSDFVEQNLFEPAHNGGMSTPMDTVIAQMTGAIVYKKAFFERVWTQHDEGYAYDKVAWRPSSTCAIVRDGKNGAFRGFKQRPVRLEDTDEITIPTQRAFVYIHGQHRNPMEGISDFNITYWCYQTSQKIRFLWYSFLEGQALPKTIIKGRDKTTIDKAVKKIIQLRSGGVAGLEGDLDIAAHESSGRGASQFLEALKWLDMEASNSVLAGFTDLGAAAVSGTGSFALSKDQTDFFLMSEQAKSREMQSTINSYLIPDLVAVNFGPKEKMPRFEFGPIAEDDAAQAISLLQATAPAHNENSPIPDAFYDELIERVAGFLGLNTQIVREGLDASKKEAEEKAALADPNPAAPAVAGMAAAVNTATNVVGQRILSAVPDERPAN
jgi:hypothetical protein